MLLALRVRHAAVVSAWLVHPQHVLSCAICFLGAPAAVLIPATEERTKSKSMGEAGLT